MAVLGFLTAWYNLIFFLPLLVCALFITLQVTLGLFESGSEGGQLEAGHDAGGHGVGHKVDADADIHVHVDAHGHALDVHGHATDAVHHGHVGELLGSLLGAGKAPFSVLIETFGMSFGLIGILLNWAAFQVLSTFTGIFLVVTLPAALVGAVISTRTVASLLHRLVPSFSSTAVKSHAFVGQTGVVTSARVTRSIGEVKIAGMGQTPSWIAVRLAPESALEELPGGHEVVVTRYDADANLFWVMPVRAARS